MNNQQQQFRNAALMVIGFFVISAFITGEFILLLIAFVPPIIFLLMGGDAGIDWNKIDWLPKFPDAQNSDKESPNKPTQHQPENPFAVSNPRYDAAVSRVKARLEEEDLRFNPISRTERDSELDTIIAQTTAVLDKNPKIAEAYLQRASAYAGKRQWNDALPDLNLALYHEPRLAQAHVLRGNVLMGRDDLAGAIQEWDKALKIDPRLAVAFANRGYVKATLGKIDDALKDVNQSIELDPDFFAGYGSRGYIQFMAKEYDKAREDFVYAANLDPSYPLPFAGLAIIHQIRDEAEDAQRFWRWLMDYDEVYHTRDSFQKRHMCSDEFADIAGQIIAGINSSSSATDSVEDAPIIDGSEDD